MSYESFEPCAASGFYSQGMICYHHLLTQKAYPEHAEKKWNKFPCTLAIHNEFHSQGSMHITNKYPRAKRWMIDNGWTILKLEHGVKKWVHDLEALDA